MFQQLRTKRAGYLKTLKVLNGKLKLEKLKRLKAIREQERWKREKARLEQQKADYIRAEGREKANYLREVVRGRHLRKRQQEMDLKLKEMIVNQHKAEASFEHMKRIQEEHWKNKIGRGRRIYKRLHEEVAAIRRRFVHEKQSVRKAALVLQRLKLHIRKVIHKNHMMELHVKSLERVLHRRRLLLKHRSAKINAEWKEQDRAFKSEAHRRSILEHKLGALKKKLSMERADEKVLTAKYTKLIVNGQERTKKIIFKNHLMIKKLRKLEARVRSETRKVKAERRSSALRVKHARALWAALLRHGRKMNRGLKLRLSLSLKRLDRIRKEVLIEKTQNQMMHRKFAMSMKNSLRQWRNKHAVIAGKISKTIRAVRSLKREIKDAKLRGEKKLRELQRLKLKLRNRNLKAKALIRETGLYRLKRSNVEREESQLRLGLVKLRGQVKREHHRLAVLGRTERMIDRNGKIKFRREHARFERMRRREELARKVWHAKLRKLSLALKREKVQEQRNLAQEKRVLVLRSNRWRAKEASKMHHMYVREGRLIAGLKARVRLSRKKLRSEMARWAKKELSKKKLVEHENHLIVERIDALKAEITKARIAAKLKVSSDKAKWKHEFAERKRKAKEELSKLNAIRVRDLTHLRQERLGVTLGKRETAKLKNQLSIDSIRYGKEVHRVRGLKQKQKRWVERLRFAKGRVRKFSLMVSAAKRANLKARKEQKRLAKALKALKKRQQRWVLLSRKRGLEARKLQNWRSKVALMRRRMVAEREKLHRVTVQGSSVLGKARLKLKQRMSDNHHLKLRLAKKVGQLNKLHARLRMLTKRQIKEERAIKNEVFRVKQLTVKVHKVRNIVNHLKEEAKSALMELREKLHAISKRRHEMGMLRRKLKHANMNLHAEDQKEKEVSLQIKHERHLTEQNNLKLRKLRKRLSAIRKANKLSSVRVSRMRKALQFQERKIKRRRAELRAVDRKYKLKVREEAQEDKSQRQHIRKLMQELKAEQKALRIVERKKSIARHARAKLIALLKSETRRRLKQSREMAELRKELGRALKKQKFAEQRLHKQMELTRHLRKMFSCGKLRVLVSREKKYSSLLKNKGQKLKRLARVLYEVDNKVKDLRKRLKKGVLKWRTLATERRKEIRRAERYVKREVSHMKKEESHLRRRRGVV